MRKSILMAAVFVVAAFSVGYLAGSANGVGGISAANKNQTGPTTTPTPKCAGARPFSPHAGGTVSGVSGNTITISPATGFGGVASTVTQIVTNSTTRFYSGRGVTGSLSDVKKGEVVHAVGTLSADGKTLAAATVFIGTGRGVHLHFFGGVRPTGPHAAGTVSEVHGTTISVTPLARFGGLLSPVTTIETNSSTTFSAGMANAASLSSIKSGDMVVASGSLSSDGKTLTATRVFVVDPNALRSRFMHAWGHFGSGHLGGVRLSLSMRS